MLGRRNKVKQLGIISIREIGGIWIKEACSLIVDG